MHNEIMVRAVITILETEHYVCGNHFNWYFYPRTKILANHNNTYLFQQDDLFINVICMFTSCGWQREMAKSSADACVTTAYRGYTKSEMIAWLVFVRCFCLEESQWQANVYL